MSAALAAVAFTNAARMVLMARNVRKIELAFLPKRKMSHSATRLTKSVLTIALAMMNAETFSQITGSPKVAIAGLALTIPVNTRPQIKSMDVR